MLVGDDLFADSDIYVYEYPTAMWNRSFVIDEIAENLRLQLDADSVSSNTRIIFLAHSMGGLAVRAYLLRYREIATHTKLIYFFATPSTGSEVSSLARFLSANPQFRQMEPMQSDEYLAAVQRDWLAAAFPIPSYCAYETQRIHGFLIVNQASAASLCSGPLDPVDADHIQIVKPANRQATAYLAFKNAYREKMKNSPSHTEEDLNNDEVLHALIQSGCWFFERGTAIPIRRSDIEEMQIRRAKKILEIRPWLTVVGKFVDKPPDEGMQMAQRRAHAVEAILVEHNIPAQSIATEAFGETDLTTETRSEVIAVRVECGATVEGAG